MGTLELVALGALGVSGVVAVVLVALHGIGSKWGKVGYTVNFVVLLFICINLSVESRVRFFTGVTTPAVSIAFWLAAVAVETAIALMIVGANLLHMRRARPTA